MTLKYKKYNDDIWNIGLEAFNNDKFEAAYSIFMLLKNKGVNEAHVYLGRICMYAKNNLQNDKRAIVHFKEAAENGSCEAQYHLGMCYADGIGVEEDDQEANHWLLLAAEEGHAGAQCELGLRYKTGRGLEKNHKEALRFLRLAAAQGEEMAKACLQIRKPGAVFTEFEVETKEWNAVLAEEGGAESEFLLGCAEFDSEEAFRWFSRAAEAGHGDAQFRLACCYWYGDGVGQDEAIAMSWLRAASKNGVKEAQEMKQTLEEWQFESRLQSNDHEAKTNVIKAAKKGDPRSIYYLATLSASYSMQARLFREAAEKGFPKGYERLGYTSALDWMSESDEVGNCRRAAEEGTLSAQVEMGLRYKEGASRGVPLNYEIAKQWLSCAAENGDVGALYEIGLWALEDLHALRYVLDDRGDHDWIFETRERLVDEARTCFHAAASQGHNGAVGALRQLDQWD